MTGDAKAFAKHARYSQPLINMTIVYTVILVSFPDPADAQSRRYPAG
jgi:hypothetical protein